MSGVNASASHHSLSQASLSSQPSSVSQAGIVKGKSNKSKRGGFHLSSGKEDPQVVLPSEACSLAIPITSSFSKAGGSNGKQGFRFSLRRMLYNSPLVVQRRARSLSGGNNLVAGNNASQPGGSGASASSSTGALKKKKSSSSTRFESESPSDASSSSQSEIRAPSRSLKCAISESENWECPLCLAECSAGEEYFPQLLSCSHRSCLDCLQQYLRIEISESRVNINCPECSEPMHPNDIRMILNNEGLLEKYEDFMLRRVLATEPDARWCPAPDCNFAVLATGCASCPRLLCQRPGCGSSFCYHCKALWHPNLTCDAARAQRSSVYGSTTNFKNTQRDDIKPCPRCQVLIAKMDDGSCNHMTCALCGSEFCWLCMKEISDLHYLSPSGCTFWGKKPWSRKKKILWQLGTLVGAPVGIALLAGIAVPAMIIGIPIWVGRKLYARFKTTSKHKRNIIITSGVAASVIVAPAIAGVAVGVGVPILLAYIYGVVPVSLCQNGVCGVSTSPLGVRIDFDDEEDVTIGGTSGSGGIGPGSALALASGAQGTALNPGGGTLLGELSDKNSSTDTHGRSRHHHHRHSSRGGSSTSGANTLGSSGNGKHNSNTDAVSLDASSNLALVGNPSIGEGSVALSASGSASLGSASQLYLRGGERGLGGESDREDCESASQLGLAGSIMSAASASRRQLEVQAELASIACSPNKRSSFASSETASATISLSERSAGGLSMADDGAASVASTRALAGSILSYKMGDSGSVHSYRHGGASNGGGYQTSVSASGSVKSGYAPIEVHSSCLADGEILELGLSAGGGCSSGAATGRSSSPVSNVSLSGDELTLPPSLVSLRRSTRRAPRFAASALDEHGQVRFDEHVSYIDRTTAAPAAPADEDDDDDNNQLYLDPPGFRTPPEDSEST